MQSAFLATVAIACNRSGSESERIVMDSGWYQISEVVDWMRSCPENSDSATLDSLPYDGVFMDAELVFSGDSVLISYSGIDTFHLYVLPYVGDGRLTVVFDCRAPDVNGEIRCDDFRLTADQIDTHPTENPTWSLSASAIDSDAFTARYAYRPQSSGDCYTWQQFTAKWVSAYN